MHERNPRSCFSPKFPLCCLILPQQAHLFETQMKGDSLEDGGQKSPKFFTFVRKKESKPCLFLVCRVKPHPCEWQDWCDSQTQTQPKAWLEFWKTEACQQFPWNSLTHHWIIKGPKDDFIYIHLLRSHLTPISKKFSGKSHLSKWFQRGSPQCRCWA